MHVRLLTIEEWERLASEADFRPAKMASKLSVSPRQLQRLFRHQFQLPPSRWLRLLQCRLSKELVGLGLSNKETAHKLNFSNDCHFCREFKKCYGDSPQKFSPARP